MKIIDDVLVPAELHKVNFCCDLRKCKGACCVAGDAGAPIEAEEIELIQEYLEAIKSFMQPKAAEIINCDNLFDYDQDGNFVTALLNHKECVFTNFEAGIAYCAIEKAYQKRKIAIRKPISCFLYPIRVVKEGVFRKLVYHHWDICHSALEYGNNNKIRLVDFLQVPLREKFGKEWYKLFYKANKGI